MPLILDRRAVNWKLELTNIKMTLIKRAVTSTISEHRLQFERDFDWINIKILDNERYIGKRLVSEMLNILRCRKMA